MGLLDMFDNGDAQLGLGLLGAAAPRADGAGFGQRLMEGVGSAQAMRNQQMQRQMQQLEFQQKTQQMNMLNGVLARLSAGGQQPPPQRAALDNGAPMGGGLGSGTFGLDSIPGQSLSPSPMGNNNIPATPISASQPQQAGGINGMSANDIAAMQIITGKDLSPIWKTAKEGFTQKSGDWHVDANTGERTYVPDPTKGLTVDSSGKVGFMPGSIDAQTQLAAIPEAAKAAWTLVTVPDGNGGTKTVFAPQAKEMLGGGNQAPTTPEGPAATLGGTMPSADALETLRQVANSNLPQAADARTALGLYQQRLGQNSPIVNQGAPKWGYTPPAAQLEADKATALAGVKLATNSDIQYKDNAATAFQKYGEGLNGRLAESQALLQRIEQSKNAAARFSSGGGTEARAQVATMAQAVGAPQALVDRIAGGDLSAVQEFQKYAAQEALQTMRQALSSETGAASSPGNRVAMQVFFKNNPNIDTDPRAIEKIFNFQTGLHNDLLKESDLYTKYLTDPTKPKDPAVFMNDWAHRQVDTGRVNPGATASPSKPGQPSGRVATLADISATAKASGKTTAQVTADLRRAGFTIGGQ